MRTTSIHVHGWGIRILDNGNHKMVKKSEVSVFPRITTWDTLDHLLILDLEGFVVEEGDEDGCLGMSMDTCSCVA